MPNSCDRNLITRVTRACIFGNGTYLIYELIFYLEINMSEDRDFKGVWIPKEIWLDKELSLIEKCIYVEIDSLDNENHCIAGNEYFAEFCNCSESKVSKAIKHLQDLNMIEIMSFDGRRRKIRVVKNTKQGSKIYEAGYENLRPINTSNNIDNKETSISKDIDDNGGNFHFGKDNKNKSTDDIQKASSFIELYHNKCPNLPRVTKMTDKRIKAISKIQKKYTQSEIIQVFELTNNSEFLTGNNNRGWKADIDFITREEKFVSILEGKYNTKHKLSEKVSSDMGRKVQRMTSEQKKQLKEEMANGKAEKF